MHGVYIHVPFCAKRCDYCAFATFTDRHHLTSRYLAAMKTHIGRAIDSGMPPASSKDVSSRRRGVSVKFVVHQGIE